MNIQELKSTTKSF